jgi:hypothetical protein
MQAHHCEMMYVSAMTKKVSSPRGHEIMIEEERIQVVIHPIEQVEQFKWRKRMHVNQDNTPLLEQEDLRAGVSLLYNLSQEELIQVIIDDCKNWLAHDGLWFQAVEGMEGMDKAIEADRQAWKKFTVIEAKRIMARLGLEPGGGIPALVECLKHRMYARLNLQRCIEVTETRCVFQMVDCRVQSARKRKNLPDFPCKPVGLEEYSRFASAIDPRISTRCIACPPDAHPEDYYCAWEFTRKE